MPLIVKWPSRLGSGLEFEAAVHHVDLFRTIAAAAGADPPQDRKIDGVSLLPFLLAARKGIHMKLCFGFRDIIKQFCIRGGS